jgi:hypothetical protein
LCGEPSLLRARFLSLKKVYDRVAEKELARARHRLVSTQQKSRGRGGFHMNAAAENRFRVGMKLRTDVIYELGR